MTVDVRIAGAVHASIVAGILAEAVEWLVQSGTPMWQPDEVDPELVAQQVAEGAFALAWVGDEAAGTVRFQLEDPLFWPDAPSGEAAYVHRLAVRRRFAGAGVSTALLSWAVAEARAQGRRVLRLDCDAARTKVRHVYERFGFRYHSDRQVGPHFVARYEYAL